LTDTRARIVEATAALFMQQGYPGTGLKAIVESSEATIGSLYHFFPGGKAELAAATLRQAGQAYEQLVVSILDAAPDIVTGIRDCFAGAAEVMRATDYVDACPVATVALEVASSDETLRVVTEEIFAGWLTTLGHRFQAGGLPPDRAHHLATVFVATLEGGFLLSRVAKDAGALEMLGMAVVELAERALADSAGSSGS
jgi:AcrR family transcriptional regulator